MIDAGPIIVFGERLDIEGDLLDGNCWGNWLRVALADPGDKT